MATINLASVGHTNGEVYTVEETQQIRPAITSELENLRQIDGKLSNLTVTTTEDLVEKLALTMNRKTIVANIGRYKAAIAPHNKLPEDIIRHVFHLLTSELVMFPLHRFALRKGHIVVEPLFVISHVCSGWRRVALNMPELWRGVQISYLEPKHLHPLQEWLSRAGSLLISVTIRDRLRPALHDFLRLYRCRDLVLRLSPPEVATLHPEALEYVENLNLIICGKSRGVVPVVFTHEQFPRLKSLKLSMTRGLKSGPTAGVKLDIRLNKLQSLDLASTPLSLIPCWSVLRQCGSLIECKVCLDSSDDSGDNTSLSNSSVEVIVLPQLRLLEISFDNNMGVDTFLDPLILPSLNTLKIERGIICWTAASYERMTERTNFGKLHELSICNCTSGTLDAGLLLKNAPCLRAIEIPPFAEINGETLVGLSTGQLGRSLHSFVLRGDHALEPLLSMVESRHKNALASQEQHYSEGKVVVPLQYVKLIDNAATKDIPRELLERENALRPRGIDIVY
ncbi:hypothetical protein AX17_002779 [Amanita inopinata Kibby_2008]|nr:hypothetical protein AX17_002779 [Amanita inopinata Kibby_2008]